MTVEHSAGIGQPTPARCPNPLITRDFTRMGAGLHSRVEQFLPG